MRDSRIVRSSLRMSYLLSTKSLASASSNFGFDGGLASEKSSTGLHDADAEIMAPNTIGEAAREERIVRRAHPLEQRDARILPLRHIDFRAAERLGRQRASGLRIGQRLTFPCRRGADVDFTDNRGLIGLCLVLAAFRVFGVEQLGRLRRTAERDGGKDVGERAIVALRPAVERMLVALAHSTRTPRNAAAVFSPH